MNDLVTKWNSRIKKGLSARKKWRDTFRIDDLDKYYEGFQQPAWWNESSFVPINLIFANIKSQSDSFKAISPRFYVRPSRTLFPTPQVIQQLEAQAKLRENILNYITRKMGFKRELQKVRLDSFVSFGVVKIIYEPYHRSNPNAGAVVKRSSGQPIIGENNQPLKEPETILDNELFSVSRRNPADILFDPLADSRENITWIAERIEFTLEELKENKLFKNTANVTAINTRVEEKENERNRKVGTEAANNSSVGVDLKSEENQIVYVWEIYDINEQRIICIAEGYEEILRDDPLPVGIDKHPYEFLWFNDRRNSPYPIPEIWAQIGPQDEYNITRNQIMIHRKRFNRKYTIRKGSMDDSEKAKLEDPYDGIIVETNTDGQAVFPIEDAALDQAVYFDVQMLRKDFMDISGEGVPEGELAKIQKATVANLVAGRQQNRRSGSESVISDFLIAIARKLMLLTEHELTIPLAISVNGPAGAAWQVVSPGDLDSSLGEFNYEISASSLTPRDPDSERTSWIAFCQFIAMNPIIMSNPIFITKTAQMFMVEDSILVDEVIKTAQALQQQQALQGGQPGQPSMSPDMQRVMNGG